jgi:hypothetical protein
MNSISKSIARLAVGAVLSGCISAVVFGQTANYQCCVLEAARCSGCFSLGGNYYIPLGTNLTLGAAEK